MTRTCTFRPISGLFLDCMPRVFLETFLVLDLVFRSIILILKKR